MRLRAAHGLVLVAPLLCGASLDSVPPECRQIVERALTALDPAIAAAKNRKIARGKKGTLEDAVRSYAPPRFHVVAEGSLPATRAGGSCPADMAKVLDRFCVDKYEGTLVERLADGSEQPWSPFAVPEAGSVYLARNAKGTTPQAYVSAKQAEAACRAVQKRLCQPVEWRVACAGSELTAYPYGALKVAGKCHDSGASPMLTFHAATMSRGWGLGELNDTRNNQLEGTVAKTGAYPDCVNDFGAYDMVGNLHEWTADPNGSFQGGFWLDTAQHGEGCAYRTISHGFEYHDYSTGFRCCADLTMP
jgi:formylglycine-generating enzyme required for sulfatase activity